MHSYYERPYTGRVGRMAMGDIPANITSKAGFDDNGNASFGVVSGDSPSIRAGFKDQLLLEASPLE